MYGDQGVRTEEQDKAMYGKLMKTQSEEEEEINCKMALCTNDSISLKKKRRQLNENPPNQNVYDVSQSNVSINENTTVNSFVNEVKTVQGPMGDNNKIKSQKACTMEMLMSNGDILITMMIELKQAREDYKNFLYARATHSSHMIQYHMQQIMEHQKVVDKYRRMMEEERELTYLELNLYKSDLAVISHIIHMIVVDNFWHQKTFEVVLADLQMNRDKGLQTRKKDITL